MSYEKRLQQLKHTWMEIQELRDKKALAQKKVKKYQKEVRSLAQEIPKRLNEFNKTMV